MELDEAQISRRVRSLLEERGISGSELARRLGASQSYVSRRIQGTVPWRATDLVNIASVLGVPAAGLLSASADAA